MILYEGPSLLTGAPIVAIATGLDGKSKNPKTGAMVQVWILTRDVHPAVALQSGDDAAICGDCSLRPGPKRKRRCYVNIVGPMAVWRAYRAGRYPRAADVHRVACAFTGKRVRIGSYGDPAAVPLWVWLAVTRYADAWTSYTHQWRDAYAGLSAICMASVESEREAQAAAVRGYRTFRVKTAEEPLRPREVACPASKEAGYKTTCSLCLACGGTSAKANAHIAINYH